MIAYAAAADVAQGFVNQILQIIVFPLVVLLLAVAVVVFLYGCFEYIVGANNETKRAAGKRHILFGLIGLLVMLAAQAILNIILATLSIATV